MRELILACIGITLQMTVFFCAGSLFMHVLRMKADASFALVIGYLLYFAVFELIAVPMTLAWVPLKVLSGVWTVLLAIMAAVTVLFLWKKWLYQLKEIPGIFKSHSFMLILTGAVILLQCLIVVLYEDTTADAAYYVGTVSTSVYTGTLGRYNPFNGNLQKIFQPRYVFSAYPMHNAVWSELLGCHAIVQAKIVMSSINVLVANLVIYHIGKKLFNGEKKQADLMVVFVCLLQLFSFTIYTTGAFFFMRSYEGKALLGNVSIPVVLLCSIWFWQKKDDKNMWVVLFITAVSAITFSGSAIIFPVVISAGILPVIFVRKQFSKLVPYVICMMPSVLYAAVYFASQIGWLTLKAS